MTIDRQLESGATRGPTTQEGRKLTKAENDRLQTALIKDKLAGLRMERGGPGMLADVRRILE
jgi:hypothetical protein